MEYIALECYHAFSCLADKCPSTCCAGWSILVDMEDYERFLRLSPDWLRQEVLLNIEKREGRYFFRNRKDGSCAMLDEDSLCRLQKHTNEETLCNTCRKYPRILNKINERLYLSMAASCPVISSYLVTADRISWNHYRGRCKQEIQVRDILLLQGETVIFPDEWNAFPKKGRNCSAVFLYQAFERMVNEVLDIILAYREGNYLLSEFLFFEQEDTAKERWRIIEDFCKETAVPWAKICRNYFLYRLISRRIEMPEEDIGECDMQVKAELFFIRLLAFCRFAVSSTLSVRDWCNAVQMMYRFCVHGKRVAAAFHQMAQEFFPDRESWKYLLY